MRRCVRVRKIEANVRSVILKFSLHCNNELLQYTCKVSKMEAIHWRTIITLIDKFFTHAKHIFQYSLEPECGKKRVICTFMITFWFLFYVHFGCIPQRALVVTMFFKLSTYFPEEYCLLYVGVFQCKIQSLHQQMYFF